MSKVFTTTPLLSRIEVMLGRSCQFVAKAARLALMAASVESQFSIIPLLSTIRLSSEDAMPRNVALSRSARALLKSLLTDDSPGEIPSKPEAYHQLMVAGLVKTSSRGEYCLTSKGRARRWEFLPHPDGPSAVARALLGGIVAGDTIEVSDGNRSAYRELAAAGLMDPLHTFAKGDESGYRMTQEGWDRRFEFIAPLPQGFSSRLVRWAAMFSGLLSVLRHAIPSRVR